MNSHKKHLEYIKTKVPLPDDNAASNLSISQKLMLLLILLVLLLAFQSQKEFIHFYRLFYYVTTVLYLVICTHKLILIIAGNLKKTEIKVSDIELSNTKTWPLYTILLPVYKETAIFSQLYKAIENIDYPRKKLDILLLIEEDDNEFKDFLKGENLPEWWRIIEIPDFKPKTKGKALNYGLLKASGEYLVIYDAEDIPEKNQLKKAALAFRKIPGNVACLQSKLNYYNPYQNIITKWFTAEYSSWFDLYLPGIDAIKAPMPLGGTSNHFKTEKLLELKGWDPFNVTEDCDLGIRIFKAGYTTRVLDTTTWEEANSELGNWLKQRSRWVKGYIQTYFVNMRNPLKLIKKIGIVNFFHFNVIVGGNFFVLCFNPVAWLMIIIWLLRHDKFMVSDKFLLFSTLVLLAGNFFFILVNVWGVIKRKWYKLAFIALLSPIYWFLMSMGAWKGFSQYIRRPHFWEKTEHALFKNYHSQNP
ncbi:MAG TPA: glycosyltransferase family 2 protein [bacterium]|nr:glycosyltransferase family 2 protein [bacterium]